MNYLKKLWTYLTGTLFLLFFCGFLANAQISVWADGDPINWETIAPGLPMYRLITDPYLPGDQDDQFQQGSKDYKLASQNTWTNGQTKFKNDLANAAVALMKIGSEKYLCFAGDRARVQGSAQIGFWLLLNGTMPVTDPVSAKFHAFDPEHAVGDLLVVADFSQGGRNADITLYKWVGGGSGESNLLKIDPSGIAVAQNNTGGVLVPANWDYESAEFKKNAFYEGYINLSKVLPGVEVDFCKASWLLECRSSKELNASLDDFASRKFAEEILCEITGPDVVCPKDEITFCGPDGPYTYKWVITDGYFTGPDNQQCMHLVAPNHCGEFVVTLTVKDVLGCEKTCYKTFKVVDTEAPVYPDCPSSVVELGCNPDPEKYATTLKTENWTDNCRIGSSGIDGGIPKPDPAGCGWSVVYVTYAIDYCGNKSTCEQKFTWIVDKEKPYATNCPKPRDLGCNPTSDKWAPGVIEWKDNCSVTEKGVDIGTPGVIDGCKWGVKHVHWATDFCGNKGECVEIITWNVDTEPPVSVNCPKLRDLSCNPKPEMWAPGKVDWKDNCGVVANGVVPGTPVNISGCLWEVKHLHWAKDYCGNKGECVEVITWTEDTKPPVPVICPEARDLECNPAPEMVAPGKVDWKDNCGVAENGVNPGTPVNTKDCLWEVKHIHWAKDICGNKGECVEILTWKVDIEPPVPQIPLTDQAFTCGQEQKIPVPVFKDNCDGIVPFGCEVTGYPGADCFNFQYPVGVTEICFTAEDKCGNINKICIKITVEPCPECETAFAKLDNDNAHCFIPDFSRWGWTNEINAEGTYLLPLYAGAAHCLGGDLVGEVKVVYAGGKVSVEYTPYAGYSFKSTSVYVGEDKYPSNNGVPTVAPGQYTYDPEAIHTGTIYVIPHADVCNLKKAPVLTVGPGVTDLKVYPNPFTRFVTFEFVSDRDAHAVLDIHNVLGQKVATLVNKQVEQGVVNRAEYLPIGQESGIFFYRLMLDNSVMKGKLIYAK